MALSLENSNLVWQKVKVALQAGGTTTTPAADSVAVASFKALKEKLAGVGGNPDLQYVAVDATLIDDASGTILADVPCKLYGIFLRKQATAVDVFTAFIDDATDDSLAAATTVVTVLPLTVSAQQSVAFFLGGLDMTVGLVAKAYTEFDGTTDSSSSDTPNGFVIIGAA